jgi:hypothetical protein
MAISGVFELAPLRDSPQVNDKLKLTEVEVETLSPMRRPSVNKPLSIAYGSGELPAMIATSRDYHAYRSEFHFPGDLIPIAKANHFTILDELRLPDSHLTRQVLQLQHTSRSSTNIFGGPGASEEALIRVPQLHVPRSRLVVGRQESFSGKAPSLALGIKMNVDSRQRQTARCTPPTKRIPSAGRVSVV